MTPEQLDELEAHAEGRILTGDEAREELVRVIGLLREARINDATTRRALETIALEAGYAEEAEGTGVVATCIDAAGLAAAWRQLERERDDATNQRDALVAELVDLFGWGDPGWLHAALHVREAVLHLKIAAKLGASTPGSATIAQQRAQPE